MKLLLLVCISVIAVIAVSAKDPKLVFEENFDTLDESRWKHLVTAWSGGNQEFVYYRNNRKNSYVENGILKIRPTPVSEEYSDDTIRHGSISEPGCNRDPCASQAGGDSVAPLFSARMESRGGIEVAYGRIEIRAKMPRGDWIWPALWMYPAEEHYGGWPMSGEIDIMEGRGNRNLHLPNGQSVGVDLAQSTMHWGPEWYLNAYYLTHWEWNSVDLSDDFHVWKLEWTEDHMTYSVDDHVVGSVAPPAGGFFELGQFQNVNNPWAGAGRMAPFDRPFFIILNVAVGGRFFGDDMINSPDPRPWDWNSGHPMLQFYEATDVWMRTWDRPAMEVDYVHVYEL